MAGLKEIRRRISSVRNTKQITRAMKLVSAAKLRRAQDSATGGRSFVSHLSDALQRVLLALDEDFAHPLTVARPSVRRRRVVVIAGERGLCGGYNTNILKAAAQELHSDAKVDFVLVGRRAVSTGRRLRWDIAAEFEALGEDASQWPTGALGDALIQAFVSEEIDEAVVYYTEFVSAITQRVQRAQLLPATELLEATGSGVALRVSGFDAPPEEIVERLVPMLVRAKIRQAALDAKASEHAARMTAMDAATRNADELIDRLRLFYNRARQTTITRELIDIVGGAEAIK